MDVVEFARAMYEAPVPDETEGAVWPPGHPEDAAWWMSRAAAVMPLLNRVRAEALREAADADDFFAHYVDGEGHDFNRGVTHGADSLFEQLRDRAARIEQNSEGNEA